MAGRFGPITRLYARTPVTVTRPGAQSFIGGRATYAASTTFTALMSIQPFTDREMFLLPEGERNKQWVKIYSQSPLQGAIVSSSQKGDIVPYNGNNYEVQYDATWDLPDMTRLQHYRLKASLIPPDQQTVTLNT